MLFSLEAIAITEKKAELEMTELNMLRFSMGVKTIDKISNDNIGETSQIDFPEDRAARQGEKR